MSDTDKTQIAQRLSEVDVRMALAAGRAGRDPASVRLVAVTKTHPAQTVLDAIVAGAHDIGENRVQEALPKIELVRQTLPSAEPPVRFHLIGHLQSNKAKQAVRNFDLIHSVDSQALAEELNRHSAAFGKETHILLQVNVSGEESKSGLEPQLLPQTVEHVLENCPALRLCGFMTMAPLSEDPEEARPHFRNLRLLAEQMRERFGEHERFTANELSMGMTNDFEVAIEEGATLVRIGSALFGAR